MGENYLMNETIDRKIIVSWFYSEIISESGVYAQMRGKSHEFTFQQIYINCLITFFFSARAANKDAKLILYTNDRKFLFKNLLTERQIELLAEFNVEVVSVTFSFLPPDKQRHWRNQFFLFDIIKHLSEIGYGSSDLIVISDSDVIWSGSPKTSDFWNQLSEIGYLIYTPIEDLNENINGYSQISLREYAKSIGINNFENLQYAGGELIALRGDLLVNLVENLIEIWNFYLMRVKHDNFFEEAHLLSLLYTRLEFNFGNGNSFIKRLWTQILHFQNTSKRDLEYVLWHLPAEKRYGLRRLAKNILNRKLLFFPAYHSKKWHYVLSTLGLPKNSHKKILLDFSYAITNRIKEYYIRFKA